jgi:GGDEF domain-containing protein
MYVYRLGGDEFLILAVNSSKEEITDTIQKFEKAISETEFKCSVGSSYRVDPSESAVELMKRAEKEMYLDKENFYKTSKIERRKQ